MEHSKLKWTRKKAMILHDGISQNEVLYKNYLYNGTLLGKLKLIRNAIKSRFIYNGRGIAFDGAGSWWFGNDFARNCVIFCVDNSSPSYTNIAKNIFLVLGKELLMILMMVLV